MWQQINKQNKNKKKQQAKKYINVCGNYYHSSYSSFSSYLNNLILLLFCFFFFAFLASKLTLITFVFSISSAKKSILLFLAVNFLIQNTHTFTIKKIITGFFLHFGVTKHTHKHIHFGDPFSVVTRSKKSRISFMECLFVCFIYI